MPGDTLRSARHTLSVVVTLSGIWLLNSGHYTPLILGLGLLSVLFVTWLLHRMDVIDHESQPTQFTLRIFPYYTWLLYQILLANLTLIKHIWLGRGNLSPVLAYVQASQKTDIGRVTYANSITLTPGTVTIDVRGNRLLVHALTKQGFDELNRGAMDRRVTELEG